MRTDLSASKVGRDVHQPRNLNSGRSSILLGSAVSYPGYLNAAERTCSIESESDVQAGHVPVIRREQGEPEAHDVPVLREQLVRTVP